MALEFDFHRVVIFEYILQNAKNRIISCRERQLIAASVGTTSTRVDEGIHFRVILEINVAARTVVGRGEKRARYVTTNLRYASEGALEHCEDTKWE